MLFLLSWEICDQVLHDGEKSTSSPFWGWGQQSFPACPSQQRGSRRHGASAPCTGRAPSDHGREACVARVHCGALARAATQAAHRWCWGKGISALASALGRREPRGHRGTRASDVAPSWAPRPAARSPTGAPLRLPSRILLGCAGPLTWPPPSRFKGPGSRSWLKNFYLFLSCLLLYGKEISPKCPTHDI